MQNYYQIKYTGDEINDLLGRINQDNFLEVVEDSHIIYEDLFELLSNEAIAESVLKYLNIGFMDYFKMADGTKLAYEDLQPELKDILNKGKELAVENNEALEAVCFTVNEQVMFIFNVSANGFALIMTDAHKKTVTITSDFVEAVVVVDENANKRDIEKAIEGLATEEFVREEVAKLVDAAPEALDTLKELADEIKNHQDVYDAYVNEVARQLNSKVEKVEGKSLVDDAEIERLAKVDNYDDAELRDMINAIEVPSIEGLASEEFVVNKIAEIEIPEVDLEPYAKKEEVEVELAKKVEKVEGKSLVDDAEIERLAKVDNYDDAELKAALEEKADKSELFSGDYNDLENKPEIPSVEGLATEQFVLGKIAEAKLEGEEVDLSIYATKEDLEPYAKKEDLTAFIVPKDLEGLASEEFVQQEIAKIEHPTVDLEPYAKKEELFNKDYNELVNKPEIPSIEGLATEQFVLGKIAEIEHPQYDDSELREMIEAIEVPSIEGLATEEFVNAAIEAIEHPQYDDSELRGMFIVDEPKKAVFNNRPYVFACGHPLLVEGKDGEVVITYAVNDTNKEMGEIRVPAEEAKSLVIVGGFGDEHIDRTRILPATHIHVRNVDIQAVYGGNLFEGIVGESTIIIENSNVKEILGGGDAGRFINGRWAVRNNVVKSNVILTDVKSTLVFAGGSGGPNNVAEAHVELNGDCEIAWLTAGGSNGFTSKSEVVINGGKYECVQMVNRGLVDEAKLVMNGGHVARAYFAGEAEDATVTGIVNHVVFELNAGEIEKLARGNSDSIEFNGDIKGHIIDCVVLEGSVDMLEKVEHVEEPDYATEEFVRAEIEAIEHPQYDDSELREMIESIEVPSVEGLATEDFVKNAIAEAELNDKDVDLSGFATKDDLKGLANEQFVKDEIAAIEHPQYDDSELRAMIDAIEVPSVDGLATEDFVREAIAEDRYNDSELRERVEALENMEIPSIEGLATEEFVREVIAEDAYDDSELRAMIDAIEVPSIEGLATEEFVREAINGLENYDDTELREMIEAIEVPSVEGLATEELVRALLADKADKADIPDISNLATEELVTMLLADKADKTEIPSVEGLASEQFVRDEIAKAQLEGEDVDLSGFATKEDLNGLANEQFVEEKIAEAAYDDAELRNMIAEKADKSELFSGDYNDLANKPEIPNVEGFATEEFVESAISNIEIPEAYDDTELREMIEAIEVPSVEGLASEEFVQQAIEAIEHPQYDDAELREMIAEKADKSEIPSVEGFANEEEVNAALALKADKTEIPSVEGLATEDFVRNAIAEAELNAGDQEVDLSGFATKDDLNGLVNEQFVQEQIAAIEHPQYNDSELRNMIAEKADKTEIPSVEGLATEEFVNNAIAAIEHPQYDDTDVKARLDALEAVEMPEIPSVEGLATEEFVREEVTKLVNAAPEAMDTLGELAAAISAHEGVYEGFVAQQAEALAKKVDAVEGFALADEAEMARLKDVHNYDDTDVKARLDALEAVEMPEVPSIEGLATEEFVQQAIEGIEHPTVDLEPYAKKEDLFSKDYNDLENKPEIPEAYDDSELRGMIEAIEVPSIEGLATEEFVQQEIAKIEFPEVPEVDLSEYAKLEALENKVDKEEGKSLIADSEIVRLATLANPNYTFKINMLPAGSEASVTTSGMYPNQIITFNIPMGTTNGDEGGEDVPAGTPRMWYGFMSYDETGETGFNEPDHINENMTKDIINFGLAKGTLIEEDPSAKGAIEVDGLLDADFLCVILPVDSGLKAWVDNGIGTRIPFLQMDPESGLAQDDCVLVTPIDGITYKVSGMYITNGGGKMKIYIDEE